MIYSTTNNAKALIFFINQRHEPTLRKKGGYTGVYGPVYFEYTGVYGPYIPNIRTKYTGSYSEHLVYGKSVYSPYIYGSPYSSKIRVCIFSRIFEKYGISGSSLKKSVF